MSYNRTASARTKRKGYSYSSGKRANKWLGYPLRCHANYNTFGVGKSNIRRPARQPVAIDTREGTRESNVLASLMFSQSRYEKTVSVLSKVLRMSFSPIENRCHSIIKALALLATFTPYREMENEGDKTERWEGGGKKGALR